MSSTLTVRKTVNSLLLSHQRTRCPEEIKTNLPCADVAEHKCGAQSIAIAGDSENPKRTVEPQTSFPYRELPPWYFRAEEFWVLDPVVRPKIKGGRVRRNLKVREQNQAKPYEHDEHDEHDECDDSERGVGRSRNLPDNGNYSPKVRVAWGGPFLCLFFNISAKHVLPS